MPKNKIAPNPKAPQLYLFGIVNSDMAARIANEVAYCKAMGIAEINVHVNCPGGSIDDGIAIFTSFKTCGMKVYGFIDGVAASMGAYICFAFDKLYISQYGSMMLHEGASPKGGTAEELREMADRLDDRNNTLVAMTVKKTGMSEADVKTKFFNGIDNWFNADKAVAAKLVDGSYVIEELDVPEAANNTQVYAMVAQLETSFKQTKNNFSMENNMTPEALAELGLSANATPGEINAALRNQNVLLAQKLKEQKEDGLKKDVETQLKAALDEKKITAEYQVTLRGLFATNPEGLKKCLEGMPAFRSVNEALNTQTTKRDGAPGVYAPQVAVLMAKGWDVLDRSGEMERLYAMDKNAYNELYEGKFGYAPNKRPVDMGRVMQDVARAKAEGNVVTPK